MKANTNNVWKKVGSKQKDHPVHTIVCMSDIYKKARASKTAEKKLAA